MKNIKIHLTVLTVFLLLFSSGTFAQLKEFRIDYDVNVTGDDLDPMTKGMMEGATLSLAFKENKAWVNMDMGIMKTTAKVDDKKKKGIVLMDMAGLKFAVPMEEKDFETDNSDQDVDVRETGKTKNILGYTCKQAFVKDENGAESEFWYTDKIQPENKNTDYTHKGINGMPLEMKVNQDGMIMTMTANKVDKNSQPDDLFDLTIPEGYSEMSKEDLENMGGGK